MMKSIRAIGFVVGVIVLAGWVSLLWSWLRSSANSSLIVGVIHNIFGHWQSIEKSEIVASIIIGTFNSSNRFSCNLLSEIEFKKD